ncbi:MAG: hypothetical protein R3A13_12445 [Bdellovibrionota bacterium]
MVDKVDNHNKLMAALKGAVSGYQTNQTKNNPAQATKEAIDPAKQNPQASNAAVVNFSKESELAQQISGQVRSDENARANKVAKFKAMYQETGTIPFDTYAVAEKFAASMSDMLG